MICFQMSSAAQKSIFGWLSPNVMILSKWMNDRVWLAYGLEKPLVYGRGNGGLTVRITSKTRTSLCDWSLRDTNKQEMVNWSGGCFRSRPMGDVGDSSSRGAFGLAPNKPLCIIITTLQLQLQGMGQQSTSPMPRGAFILGRSMPP